MDGTGKTTIAHWLDQHYQRQGKHPQHVNILNGDTVLRTFLGGITSRVRTRTHSASSYELKPTGMLRLWPWFSLLDSYLTAVWLRLISFKHPVIIDRYFYDELAIMACTGLISVDRALRLARLMPRPAMLFQFHSSARTAFTRKPEHPWEFFVQQEAFYSRLAQTLRPWVVDTEEHGEQETQTIVAGHLAL